VAGAQIVDELLRHVVGGVDIEDEEDRFLIDHKALRFGQRLGDARSRPRGRFFQGRENLARHLFIRFEDEHLKVARWWSIGGSSFVHSAG
jgi:hypothetical protein